jgi:hypothetical protein
VTVDDAVPVTVGLGVGVTEMDALGDGDVGVGVADGGTPVAELDGLADEVPGDGLDGLAVAAGVLPLGRAEQARGLHRVVAGRQQQGHRGDDHAEHHDRAASGRTRGEGVAIPPVLGPTALAQPGRQRGPLRGPAVERW